MEAIPSPPETRARSRSKTPFTKGAEENGKEGRKSPNLQAITEDLENSTAAAAATPVKTSKRQASQKAAASQSATTTSSTTTVIQTSSTTTRKSTGSAAATASPTNGNDAALTPPSSTKKAISKEMKDIENKRTREIKQNEINEKIVKKTITSTPKMSPNSSAFKLNSSHEDLDLDQHPAYKEYIQAGEFWNKYPKTDYTYSETSVDRREIGQGYVGMPNMSRRSLDRHVERVTTMIQNNPEQASWLRQRYQINPPTVSRTNKSFNLFSRNLLNYDSGDEVDLTQFGRRTTTTYHRESVFKRTFVRVWTWITSIFTVFKRRTSVTREQFRAQYGPPRVSLWSRVKTVSQRSASWTREMVFAFFKKVYLALATILYLDTLLVRQRSATEAVGVEKGAGDASTTTAVTEEVEIVEEMPRNKRRFLWVLVILLPILLLAGIVANNRLETAQIRAFLVATEKDVWNRVALAKAGVDGWRLDTMDFARRNYDAASGQAQQWIGQAQQVWTESSEKVVATVNDAWRKMRG